MRAGDCIECHFLRPFYKNRIGFNFVFLDVLFGPVFRVEGANRHFRVMDGVKNFTIDSVIFDNIKAHCLSLVDFTAPALGILS